MCCAHSVGPDLTQPPARPLGPMGTVPPPCLPSSTHGHTLCWVLALPAVGQGQSDLQRFPLLSKIRRPMRSAGGEMGPEQENPKRRH